MFAAAHLWFVQAASGDGEFVFCPVTISGRGSVASRREPQWEHEYKPLNTDVTSM